ncbi:uroporphyrinogen-III C-methyltransferase [Ferrovibrio terrae]|uniref:Uroporphyrinogen-III C-methyltransferase n=1 Tax=Ferrovibrio terrae TaxID=2594003 RepID=A0A516GYB5_9PROT|nr:siroheme synthase CysG [Ferrovibrio terrae]QDO96516.1 uroporphyrinogen-III C-methyltransferase [Ferrovibrio terrae]
MHSFPGFLNLQDRLVLVAGGGENAARKIRLLAKAGARIRVVANELNAEIFSLVAEGVAEHRAEFSADVLDGARLVISAYGDARDEAVAEAAQQRGLLVNVVDRADLSDFTVPAIVERGDITIGISSNGTAPLLLGRIRAQIEALLPARLGDVAALAGEFRGTVARVIGDAANRKRFWQRVFDGPVAAKALAGDRAGARATLMSELNSQQDEVPGHVALVGAGPGDPDLLTIAAQRALMDADIVLYDALVSPEILDRVRRDAERVSVGKRKGRHSIGQDEINILLAEHATAGKRVVRLKAGDPFIFGRGGEEMDYLNARGIAVSVIPGITAALGCAASAGIPLTHRELSHGISLVSGQLKDGSEDSFDWIERAAKAEETVVVYMGLSQAAHIRDRLIAAGASAALPVALIEKGTRPDQQVSAGALSTLPALATQHGGGPVLLIIGKVAAYARPSVAVAQQRRIA